MQEHYKEDVDLIGEVYIGRAPVSNAQEVSNFVFKTIEFEDTSCIPNNKSFMG